ncbi:MAG: cysteine synthase family protein, partial [Sphaerochaetaceae bacterium]
MGQVYKDVTQLIGRTPLVELANIAQLNALQVTLLAKLEMYNPGGSIKDRIAKAMVERAEEEGLLREGSTIIEPTSGNTGIGLALVAAAKGYRLILTMPETMSRERRLLFEAYGAEAVLTDGALGMQGSIAKAEELAKEIPNAFIPNQFANMANPEVHYRTTGVELWEDSNGQIDYFVATVGTGGTISGVGGYLKSKKSSIEVIAVEPAGSPLLSTGIAGKHQIQGIGAGFIPATLNTKIYD